VATVCRSLPPIIPPLSAIPIITGSFSGGASSASWSIVSGGGAIENVEVTGNTVTADYVPVYDDVTAGSVTLRLAKLTNPQVPALRSMPTLL
jgi:hypothetical protein